MAAASEASGPVLFLADAALPGPRAGERAALSQPWLLPHALAAGWRAADLELLPQPCADIAERLAVMADLEDVFARFAAHLAGRLNVLHGLDLPQRSWELLFGAWLQVFLHMVRDRHARLELARRRYGSRLAVPAPQTPPGPARSYDELTETAAHGGGGVLALYGAVARRMGVAVRDFGEGLPNLAARPLLESAPPALEPPRPARCAPPDGRVLAHLFWPPPALCADGLLALYEADTRPPERRAFERGGLLAGFVPRDDFERVAAELLPGMLPPALAEELAGRLAAAGPFAGRRAYFSPYWNSESPDFLAAAALGAARGAAILGWQHGGTYGQFQNCPTERLERRLCDVFATWGWDDGDAALPARLESLPQLYAPERLDAWRGGADELLWVSTSVPRHTYRLQLYGQDATVLPLFFRMRRDFAAGLAPDVLARTVLRPYLYDYGWGNEDQALAAAHSGLAVSCAGPLGAALARARLVVCDHVGTAMLEALLLGAPTILFWDRGQGPEREAARPLFDALRAAGVLHHDAAGAARAVCAAWDDPARWWAGKEIQAARRLFLRGQCRTDADPVARWREFFRKWAERG